MKKIAFILTLLLLICIVGCSNNNSSSSTPNSNKEYKYGLTFNEYKAYLYWFGFISNGDEAFMKEGDSFPIENNERTEFIVKRFNYIFFSDKASSNAKQHHFMLSKYGITKETPLTVEWVCNNPYDAFNIMNAFDNSLKEEIRIYPPEYGYPLPDDSMMQDSSSNV